MAEERYQVGDRLVVTDLAAAPEGSWVVQETMQFLRAQTGHSIASLTPIEGATVQYEKTPTKFSLIYGGSFNSPKSACVSNALNTI